MTQKVILVNEKDEITGEVEKLEAHQRGLLHRAFSVFIFSSKGEMLLQQRATSKYHSGGLWSNACCSHPSPGKEICEEAQKRLKEEMGFETTLDEVFNFIYKADFENDLTEYEYDHVFVGEYEGPVTYDNEEVMAFCYKPMREIQESLKTQPQNYTAWFHIAFPKIKTWWKEKYKLDAEK